METKDVLEYLGIEAEDLDSFKEKFNSQYFTEEQVFKDPQKLGKFTSKTLSGVEHNAFKIAEGFGVQLNKDELKGKKTEEIFNAILETKETQHQNMIKELQEKATKGADEKYQTLQSDYEKMVGKVKDFEDMNKSLAQKVEATEKEWSSRVRDFKKSYLEKDLFGSIKYDPNIDPYKKKGFEAEVREKYKFDFDENDQPYVTDAEGKRIENPAKHGTFKTPQEVLDEVAKEAGVVAVAPQGGRPVGRVVQEAPKPSNGVPEQRPTGRRLNPRAMV